MCYARDMHFKTLDPEVAWKSIEGYHNELADEQKALDAFYRQFRCPVCKSTCHKETVAAHAFADKELSVARSVLRCDDASCRCMFDPHTGMVVDINTRGMDLASLPKTSETG